VAGFSHIDAEGKAVMVDVSGKEATARVATAKGSVVMQPETLSRIMEGSLKKGDVLSERSAVDITATCKVEGPTGVEMEAMTAVAVAALTVYDMCKAVDRSMTLTDIRLTYKAGGKSGTFEAT
jgi:cyclic pyranopterin phosphate synthase